MRIYIRSTNFQLWLVIKNGEEVPMKKVGDKLIPKTEDEFDAEDIKKVENYAKEINMLYCAVNPDDYRKISCCSTAKEMWDKLEVTYEGTDQRKGIALKASKEPTMNDSSDEDEVKLIMKKFCKLLKKEKAEDGPVCFGCGEAGHIKNKCPRNGRNARHFKEQRAYISWGGDSGDESSEQEEDEEANLCLIAQEEEESANDENQEGSLFPLVVRRKGIFLRVEVLECGISEQVLLRLVGLEFSGCNGLLSTHKSRAATSGRSKSKSRVPTTSSEERLYYGDGSYLWFDSEEERTRFLTFFSKRVVAPPRIIPERYPELQGYDDLDAQLHQPGLWPFVSRARKEINPALIRAFYSNLRREDDVIYSLIKSTPIELTVEQLGRIAGLPFQGEDVSHYGGEDWVLNNEGLILNELGITELIRHASGCPTIHSGNPEGRLVLYIVSRIIKPRKHGHTIMSGNHHRWPAHEGHEALDNQKPNLHQAVGQRRDCHCRATPRRTAPAAGPAEPQARANLASIADSLNRLHLKVDGMEGYLERLDVAVQCQGYAMNAYFQGINYVPPPLHGTFLGEVYRDEDEEDGSYSQSSSQDEDKFDDAIDGDEMDVNDDEEETEDEN
ncbi:unnamed protein product [Cuscuta campestris]|uniref:CCHC-type domain-containing protein n=1 Tax=Cuscuta campestris TaxID=132261 RepID=A0A484MIS5_9ASTE|nr:unnamed protein product [Cuscuta campestris]